MKRVHSYNDKHTLILSSFCELNMHFTIPLSQSKNMTCNLCCYSMQCLMCHLWVLVPVYYPIYSVEYLYMSLTHKCHVRWHRNCHYCTILSKFCVYLTKTQNAKLIRAGMNATTVVLWILGWYLKHYNWSVILSFKYVLTVHSCLLELSLWFISTDERQSYERNSLLENFQQFVGNCFLHVQ